MTQSTWDYALDVVRQPALFREADVAPFLQSHWSVPITAVILYAVLVVAVGPRAMRNVAPFELTFATRTWNAIVALFSIVGAAYTVPHLISTAAEYGWRHTLCGNPQWYVDGIPGLATYVFMWSKFFELVDTVFLVLRKREIIFLHWYHHITVLLFCWLAFPAGLGFGFWFCTMNYYVHAIMYSYYFFMGFAFSRPIVRPFAQLITLLQIFQMLGGMGVIVAATVQDEPCFRNDDVRTYGLLMYASYLVLFCHFFYRSYIAKAPKRMPAAAAPASEMVKADVK